MATGKKEYVFKNCTVNIEGDEITEYEKDGAVLIHSLSELLEEIESIEHRINFSIKIDKAMTPKSVEGKEEE